MKTKHFLLLVLAFIIAIPNYAQKPKKTEMGDIVITSCVDKVTELFYGKGNLEITSSKKPISISFEDIKTIKTSDNKIAFQLSEAYAHFDEMNITILGDMLVYLDLTEMKYTLSHKIVCAEGTVAIYEKTSNSFISNKTDGIIIPEYPVEIESAMPNKLQKGYIFKQQYSLDSPIAKYVNITQPCYEILLSPNKQEEIIGFTKGGDIIDKIGVLSKDKKRNFVSNNECLMYCLGAYINLPDCITRRETDNNKYLVFPTSNGLKKGKLKYHGNVVFKIKENGQILSRSDDREENLKACADIWNNYDKYEMVPYNGEWVNKYNDSLVTVVRQTQYISKDEYDKKLAAQEKANHDAVVKKLVGTYTGNFKLGTMTIRFNSNKTFSATIRGSQTKTSKTLVGVIRDVMRFYVTVKGTYNVKFEEWTIHDDGVRDEFADDSSMLRTISLKINDNESNYNVTRTINGVREPGNYGDWLGQNVLVNTIYKFYAKPSGKELLSLNPFYDLPIFRLKKIGTTTKKK